MNALQRHRQRARVRQRKIGQAPGTAIYVGEPSTLGVGAREIRYDRTFAAEAELDLSHIEEADYERWIDVAGIHQDRVVNALTEAFGVHPLWVEDILNPSGRPRYDRLGNQRFFLLRLPHEQIVVISGPRWVLSFREQPTELWDSLRQRLLDDGRIRRMGADFLLHALVDEVVDRSLVAVSQLRERLFVFEKALPAGERDRGARWLTLRDEVADWSRVARATQTAVATILTAEHRLADPVRPFFADLADHALQFAEDADSVLCRVDAVWRRLLVDEAQRARRSMRMLGIAGAFGLLLVVSLCAWLAG